MRRLAALALAAAACAGPPDDTEFAWRVAVAELPEALLAVCADRPDPIAVGGVPGRGLALAWTGGAWEAAELPADTGLLWWCWSAPDGTLIAVGEAGTIVRRDPDGRWTRDELGGAIAGGDDLYGVWGTGLDDLHVVGGNFDPPRRATWIHRDERGWDRVGEALPDQVLFKAWGISGDDVWVVGTGGSLLRFDGAAVTAYTAPASRRLIAVWGRSADDVYAVGGELDGVVLRFDGAAWATWARTPEALSGVWTAPGAPLYVGGARGYLARLAADGEADVAVPLPNVDVHGLSGGAGGVVFATGRDLLGDGVPSWRGAVLVHRGSAAGEVVRPPVPDAGPNDDAAPPDADTDAGAVLGRGQRCDTAEAPPCAPGLVCWGVLEAGVAVCTEPCDDVLECSDYGAKACCERPGFQTLQRVCIPSEYCSIRDP